MLQFTKLGKDVQIIEDFMEKSNIEFCDITIGAKYMWRDEFKADYAIFDNTLILKETTKDYKDAFYYPIGENIEGAMEKVQEYCLQNNIPLLFCCIDNEHAVKLVERYKFAKVYNDRDWSDYIYEAEKFKTYSGKKYSGQRNHVNKFKKTYPDYEFSIIKEEDLGDIDAFLKEYERTIEYSLWTQKEEQEKVREYIQNSFKLKQLGGLIRVGGKVVAISLGERIKNTLVIHVEKGLKDYAGVYPTMAKEFANAFAVGGVKFINREEDCGDMGLRISKLQYHPIEVKQKNFVLVDTVFTRLKDFIFLSTERLTISTTNEKDKEEYANLYLDDELNKYWGYDYRSDLNGVSPDKEYFYRFMQGLKEKKEEYSLAVKKNDKMFGEVVLHNFDYYGNLEIGFRIERDMQQKGYAFEAVSCVITFLLEEVKPKSIKAKCFKQNISSYNLLVKLGFEKQREDDTYYYFIKND